MPISSDLCSLMDASRVLTRPIDLIAFASDASFYRLIPQAVVQPDNIEEIKKIFIYSHEHEIPVTFRAAGTSLWGQGVTDGILVDISRYWRKIQVEDGGLKIRLQPGVIGSNANYALKPFGRRIGPDPASIDAAMLGGMIGNNASGMCCGVIENSYHTMDSIKLVLPNGLELDTSDPGAHLKLDHEARELAEGVVKIKREIEAQPDLVSRIRTKYRTKNTTGYSLNAFLDYDEPLEILAHLMVGSEGTLGFIVEIVLNTLPDYPYKYTGLLIFNSVKDACDAVFPIRDSGARAIEFMDRAALRSVENEAVVNQWLKGFPEDAAALLVEYQVNTGEELEEVILKADNICSTFNLFLPSQFTKDTVQQSTLWKIRKGLYPSIGGMRRQGTTVVIEDVAFGVEQLADATLDLQALFRKHHYDEAIIFGHAKDGNLHFVLTPSFNEEEFIKQYSIFMDDMVELVTKKYDGALKAEHGTGRNIAPFVEAEWGFEAAQIMKQVKHLIDPSDLLNPGVIINSNPEAHIQQLKPWPVIEEEVDKCIECGFCEPKCASRDLTLTPRQRIVVRREIKRLVENGEDRVLLESLVKDYQYNGMETCAIDGYCSLNCPVHINVGDLVKRLRTESISTRGHDAASFIGKHFLVVENSLRIGVGLGHLAEKVVGVKGVAGVSILGEKLTGTALPKWSGTVPRPNFYKVSNNKREPVSIIYFPSCISRIMGTSPMKEDVSLPELVVELGRRAGINVKIPPDSPGNCCGMPFSSKGYRKAFLETLHRTIEKFWIWSQEGKLPFVIDSSSCAYTLLTADKWLTPSEREKYNRMTILDPIEWVYSHLLGRLKIRKMEKSVVLHPNCSAVKLGLAEKMVSIAKTCAALASVPHNLKCCGFAGDRGLLFPELNISASFDEAQEAMQPGFEGFYSSNITCEMGMRQATGKRYRSILYLVEEATR